jgi:hypothetical protein
MLIASSTRVRVWPTIAIVFFALFATTSGRTQDNKLATPPQPPAQVPAPAKTPGGNVAVSNTPAPAAPEVDSVALFPEATQTGQSGISTSSVAAQNSFVLEVRGKNFSSLDPKTVRVIPVPASGVTDLAVSSISTDGTKLFIEFNAPATYALKQVVLSISNSAFLTFDTGTESCDFKNAVSVVPEVLPENQSKTKYGNGIGTNFYAIQLSLVNTCPMPVDIPLAGIRLKVAGKAVETTKGGKDAPQCDSQNPTELTPFALDHLTSIYTEDRQLTGARAIYFNSLQAAATIGSSIEPFFGHGFTQAVAILGGGFTTASKQIFVDMSAQQLQDITSQSFGTTEQLSSSNGSEKKFIFVQSIRNCKWDTLETNLRLGKFDLFYEVIPASAQIPAIQHSSPAPAITSASAPGSGDK